MKFYFEKNQKENYILNEIQLLYSFLSQRNDNNLKNIPHSSINLSSRLVHSKVGLSLDMIKICQFIKCQNYNIK